MKSLMKNKINDFLKDLRNIEYFPKIEFIILYGSFLDKNYFEDSDIDICIYIKGDKQELAEIRLNLLKKFENKFDLQIYQLLPIYVQVEILKGEILYVKDQSFLYDIAYQTIEEYEDFYPLYSDYINR